MSPSHKGYVAPLAYLDITAELFVPLSNEGLTAALSALPFVLMGASVSPGRPRSAVHLSHVELRFKKEIQLYLYKSFCFGFFFTASRRQNLHLYCTCIKEPIRHHFHCVPGPLAPVLSAVSITLKKVQECVFVGEETFVLLVPGCYFTTLFPTLRNVSRYEYLGPVLRRG